MADERKKGALYGTSKPDAKCCGTCKWSIGNCAAVGIRLGCRRGHVGWFAMPDDLPCNGKDWEQRYVGDFA